MLHKIGINPQKLSPNLLKIVSNAGWLLADRILRMGVGLLVGLWVARYLGPENFGIFNYAIAFASIFNVVANLGLDTIVIRNIVKEPSCKDEVLGTAFVLKMIAQIAVIVLAFFCIFLIRPNDKLIHFLVGIITLGMFFESFYVIDFWFQSQVQSRFSVWSRNVGLIISSASKLLLIQLHAPLILFALVFSAETAMSAAGLVVVYRLKGHLFRAWKFSLDCAKNLLQDSWTLILSSFAMIIYMRTDQLMLGQIIDDKAVGIYSAAAKISELWYFIPLAIRDSVFPSIIKARETSQELYYERIQKVLDFLSIISYVVALTVSLLSNQIITLFYGDGYTEAANILRVHIWSGLFISSGFVRGSWTIAEGLMQFTFMATATGAVANIFLNYFLIKMYGGIGAAISTLISHVIAAYLANLFFPVTRKIFFKQTKAFLLTNVLHKLVYKIKSFLKS